MHRFLWPSEINKLIQKYKKQIQPRVCVYELAFIYSVVVGQMSKGSRKFSGHREIRKIK